MNVDYSKYFVDAQGDITFVGATDAMKRKGETLPRAADMRFRNYVFPTAVNLSGDFPVKNSLIADMMSGSGPVLEVPKKIMPKVIPVQAHGWKETLEKLKE